MISFVVPAYNEEKYLAPTLDAIHAAARAGGEPYEIVVADDASTDATAEIAREHGARVVRVENRQIAATRNAGARASAGERLVFVDADTLVNEQLVAEVLAAFRSGAVGGGAPVRFEQRLPMWGRVFMMGFSPFYFGLARWAAGCFVFCTRAAFDATGGFDERYYASEEIHFSQALKRQGRFMILRTPVTTSTRKLDHHSSWELLSIVTGLLARGPAALRKPGKHVSFWYPDRR